MALDYLILLRHGETDWNRARRMQGHRDLLLNARGEEQAREASVVLREWQPDLVVTSDLQRCVATARIVAGPLGLDIHPDVRLRETDLGQWEGLERGQISATWPDHWRRWRGGGAHHGPPDGETRAQVAARAGAVVAQWSGTSASRALFVTHAGVIIGLTGALLGLPDEVWSRLAGVGNCRWTVLRRTAVGWQLHSYNAGVGASPPPRRR